MKWSKKGLIYVPNGNDPWAQTHAMIPTPELLDERIRIYLASCDSQGVARPSYIEVDAKDPSKVLTVLKNPLLDVGLPGAFDENGVIPTSILTLPDGRKILYYAGFELGTKIRYRLLTGAAISLDEGKTFERIQRNPMLERSDNELYFRCGAHVIRDDDCYKLWYVAGSEWTLLNNKSMPAYTIHYLESKDGLTWGNTGREVISIENNEEHGFGRPYVIKEGNLYKMFYSIRVKNKGYRLGYAESTNGLDWKRKDKELGLDVSPTGWDSETICYSSVISYNNQTYLFYNGNDFGGSGIGYAKLE